MKLDILYEDNHVIVVYKEAGILSQSDGSNKIDILNLIKDYLVKKYNKTGNAYLGLVHRLDTNTAGVMVFAKTSKAANRLSLDIKNNKFTKKYLAVINSSEKFSDKGTLIDYLDKDEKNNQSYVTNNNTGKEAILKYEIIEKNKNYSLVDIELITGRHHQIRVQFSSRGCPLYGDIKYGSEKNKNFELALQAYNLSFVHPITKEEMTFKKFSKKGIFKEFTYEKNC